MSGGISLLSVNKAWELKQKQVLTFKLVLQGSAAQSWISIYPPGNIAIQRTDVDKNTMYLNEVLHWIAIYQDQIFNKYYPDNTAMYI